MRDVYIYLPTIDRVQRFVSALTKLDGDFELIRDQYILDARSLMGIFNLDLSSPVLLRVYNDNAENMAAIAPYVSGGEENNNG